MLSLIHPKKVVETATVSVSSPKILGAMKPVAPAKIVMTTQPKVTPAAPLTLAPTGTFTDGGGSALDAAPPAAPGSQGSSDYTPCECSTMISLKKAVVFSAIAFVFGATAAAAVVIVSEEK